jgi:hypothetical protein
MVEIIHRFQTSFNFLRQSCPSETIEIRSFSKSLLDMCEICNKHSYRTHLSIRRFLLQEWRVTKLLLATYLLQSGFLFGLFIDSEDGENMFLRNLCWWHLNSVASVRKRTIPTERPPLVSEVSAHFFAARECHVVSVTNPSGRILEFLDRSRYYFFQVAPQLCWWHSEKI